jgi:hypothetical protein
LRVVVASEKLAAQVRRAWVVVVATVLLVGAYAACVTAGLLLAPQPVLAAEVGPVLVMTGYSSGTASFAWSSPTGENYNGGASAFGEWGDGSESSSAGCATDSTGVEGITGADGAGTFEVAGLTDGNAYYVCMQSYDSVSSLMELSNVIDFTAGDEETTTTSGGSTTTTTSSVTTTTSSTTTTVVGGATTTADPMAGLGAQADSEFGSLASALAVSAGGLLGVVLLIWGVSWVFGFFKAQRPKV